MPHEKDRPAGDRRFVEPGELSAKERFRNHKISSAPVTSSIPVIAQQQQPQPPRIHPGDEEE
jgi:hypothetical protein